MDTRVVLHYMKIQPNVLKGEVYLAKSAKLDFDSVADAKEFVKKEGITAALVSGVRGEAEFFDGQGWIDQMLAHRIG